MRLIVILFLVLVTRPLTESMSINNYFRLINDVHRHYRTSCVIFVHSSNYDIADLNTTTLMYTWLREFSRQQVMTMTITFADLINEYTGYRKNITRPLFVVPLDSRKTMIQFAETTKNIKPISFPIWLVVFLQHPENSFEDHCRNPTSNMFNVDFNTQMLVLCHSRPILVEWYAVRDNRVRMFDLASWTPDTGLFLKTRKDFYERRNDMFGDVLRVASVNNAPLISVKNGKVGGFLGLLLIELSKAMNFTIEVLKPVEGFGGWGRKRKIWTGAIGQLVANKADLALSAFTMTTRRQEVIDFTMPLIRSRYRLYFKQPTTIYVRWSLYFEAFSFKIWMSLIAIIIIASILLTCMKARGNFSLNLIFDNYINVWGIYCQQSLSEFPKESPMRLAFFSLYVSSIVVLAVYSASLISFLALSRPRLPFSSLEGYVQDGSYKFIVLENSAEYDIPTHVKDPVLLKMYSLLENQIHLPHTLTEGFKKICEKDKLAFYTTELFQRAISKHIQCKIVHIDTGRIDNLAIALTKGNPYTDFINYHLRQFHVNGILNNLKNRYLILKGNHSNPIYGKVDVADITPSLTMVAGSMILAIIILITERVYFFKTQSNNTISIKKLNRNLGVKNKVRKKNNKKKLKFTESYNTRPIAYYP